MHDKSIAVIILSKDNSTMLGVCLSALKSLKDESVNVYVADTGSQESTKVYLKNLQEKQYVNDIVMYENYHFAKVNNDMVKYHINHESIVIFMNDDVIVNASSIHESRILRDQISAAGNNVGTIGIRLHYPSGTCQHSGICVHQKGDVFHAYHIGKDVWKPITSNLFPVFGSTGAFLMVGRETFLEIGGFDESFDECFEDVLLNMRYIENKFVNGFCGKAYAIHHESSTRKKDPRMMEKVLKDYPKILSKYQEIIPRIESSIRIAKHDNERLYY